MTVHPLLSRCAKFLDAASGILLSRSKFSTSQPASSKRLHGVIIGPPGSGKGTISSRIVKDFKLDHLSSGDIFRSHIMNKTDFGKQIESIVADGMLVPFHLLAPIMAHATKNVKSSTGWLLDGYPRSLEQAERLQETSAPNTVIYLNVPFDTIIDRIKARWVHKASGRVYNLDFNPPKVPFTDDVTKEPLEQREDDKPTTVRNRLEIYSSMIEPVLDFYKAKGLLSEFAGTESDVIWPEVRRFLDTFLKK